MQRVKAGDVVLQGKVGLDVLGVGADVQPADNLSPPLGKQQPMSGLRAQVGKADAVDEGLVLVQTEDPRPCPARLGQRSHGANLHVAKAKTGQRRCGRAGLIVARRQPNGVLEGEPKEVGGKRRVLHVQRIAYHGP